MSIFDSYIRQTEIIAKRYYLNSRTGYSDTAFYLVQSFTIEVMSDLELSAQNKKIINDTLKLRIKLMKEGILHD
jgi:hypothetical protein